MRRFAGCAVPVETGYCHFGENFDGLKEAFNRVDGEFAQNSILVHPDFSLGCVFFETPFGSEESLDV